MPSIKAALICLILTGACASAPDLRYYTLDMRPSGTPALPCNIDVNRLKPSEALARDDILAQTSPTEIEYYAEHRWAGNLGGLVGEKLEAEFGPHEDGRATLVLSGEILSFGQVDTPGGADGHIKLDLSVRPSGAPRFDTPLLKKVYETTIPASSSRPAAVVEALSRGLEKIAVQIAEDVGKLDIDFSDID